MTAALVLLLPGMAIGGGLLAWWAGGPSGEPLQPATPLRLLVLAVVALDGLGSLVLAVQGQTSGPILVGGALLAIGLGGWLGARWLGQPKPIPAAIASGPVRWVVVVIGAAVGALALASIVAGAGLPLLASDPQGSRAAFSGLTLDVFRWLVPPAALLVVAWTLAEPTRRRILGSALALAAVAGVEVLFASRALPFELGFGAVLIVWWSGRRPRARIWLGLAAAAAVVFLGVLFARMGPDASFRDPLDALTFVADRTVGRIVLIQPQTIDAAVRAIPADEPFWGGATYLHRLGPLLGISDAHPPLGAWLYARLFPGAAPAFAAPGILAEGWVNAGAPLALGLMVVLGLGVQVFTRAMGNLGSSPADWAAAAVVTIAITRTYATSLNGFLLTVIVTAGWWLLVRPGGAGHLVGRARSWQRSGDPRREPTARG